jgi:YD repeat-containing protein
VYVFELVVGTRQGDSRPDTIKIIVRTHWTKVPQLVGQSRADAEAAIKQAKLNLGTETFQHNTTVPKGQVLTQSPGGNTDATIGTAVNLVLSLGPDNGLPPDPAVVVPPMDPTVAASPGAATKFLYTGPNAIQTLSNGKLLAQSTIEVKRAAVIRGRVLDKMNDPLSGVILSILNHPELGQTLSRADGWFDLAVNGGGDLTVDYRKDGYLWAQRQVNVPWQDWRVVDDVVLIQIDNPVNPSPSIDLKNNVMQVARGSVNKDGYEKRQATLLFPQGTQAHMVMSDGSSQPINTLSVRATEYTVGDNGPQAMPAELPPTSAYTYAVMFTADEAKKAKNVVFDNPIPFYVENFLGFPVGINVPLGAYDPEKGQWVAQPSGKVIKILSIDNGIATLATDDPEKSASPSQLDALNITVAERQQLATLYKTGQTLWRTLIPHFDQPYDLNWGWVPPDGALPPNPDTPKVEPGPPEHRPCQANSDGQPIGSLIECQNQTLGEDLPLVGTSLRLHYRSDRLPGHRAAQQITIPLSGDLTADSLDKILKCIVWKVYIAGYAFEGGRCSDEINLVNNTLFIGPNKTDTQTEIYMPWDGTNVYGQPIQGTIPIEVRIGYQYQLIYKQGSAFGSTDGDSTSVAFPEKLITFWHTWTDQINFWDQTQALALGGWSLDTHHAYDPIGKILYLGDGTRRSSQGQQPIINSVAGGGTALGDDGPAVQAGLYHPKGIAVAVDGSVYIADTGNNRIRRIGPDGIITTVAGTTCTNFHGDGILATAACLNQPTDVKLGSDGSFYIADTYNQRIRRVGTDGIITTVAGKGIGTPYSGEGGTATAAQLGFIYAIALAPDGSLYFSDNLWQIRRVGTDGIITTVAGTEGYGSYRSSDEGQPARQAQLSEVSSMAAAPDGSLYIAEHFYNRVRRIGPDGLITTVAGNGQASPGREGLPATLVAVHSPVGVALGPDGSLYITESSADKGYHVWRVGPDGNIATIAGAQQDRNGYQQQDEGAPATAATFNELAGIAVAPDGSLYVVDSYTTNRIRRIHPNLPDLSLTDFTIASTDGSQLYVFDSNGRHLRILHALTGSVLYSFDYDSAGRLQQIKDSDDNKVTIERDGLGNPTAIVAPFRQLTTLTVNDNGYLASLTNPAGEAYRISYTNDGLLTQFTDPNGHAATMQYGDFGRLILDTDATGGHLGLTRQEENPPDKSRVYSVDAKTSLDRTTHYKVEHLNSGDERRTNTFPDLTQSVWLQHTDFSSQTTLADGTKLSLTQGPDPRFAMQAPIAKSFTTATGGLSSALTSARTVDLSDPGNPLSFTKLTDTVTLNDRPYSSVYTVATRTTTNKSPAGRQNTIVTDSLGRVTQAQVVGLSSLTNTYDAQGRLKTAQQGTDADQRILTFDYNPQGYLSSITDPLDRVVGYEYDAAGRMTRQMYLNPPTLI